MACARAANLLKKDADKFRLWFGAPASVKGQEGGHFEVGLSGL